MKRCSECRRDYYDDRLLYCLDDGTALLEGPGSMDEPATAILHGTAPSSEAATRAQIHSPEQNAVFPSGVADDSRATTFGKRVLLAPAVVVLALAAFFGYRYLDSSNSGQISSIAVLPFENRSGSSDTDYLSDGLADSLIYRLTQLPRIKVSPTSSVMRYKGKETDVARIAEELKVDAVMSGRLVQRGDDLNISVQLIDARSQKLLWAEQYDRKMTDLLATQREIAAAIVDKLQLKLAGDQAKGITKKYTDSNEAYALYLKGRHYWYKRDEENLRKAIDQFKAAADQDPNFALAYAGLADCYSVLPFFSSTPSQEVPQQGKVYALRAVQLDDSLGEAHTALGNVYTVLWNWTEAEKELKRGIELKPESAMAHKFYGNFLAYQGRYDEALPAFQRALELEPLAVITAANIAEEAYLPKGDTGSAIKYLRTAIELEPNWWFAHQLLGMAYFRQGRNDEAIAEAERAVELSKREGEPLGTLGYIYAKTGRKAEALDILNGLERRYEEGKAEGSSLARVHVGLGDKDRAFSWLEKDVNARSASLVGYLFCAPFDELHADPRFRALTRRMGMLNSL